MVLAQIRLFFMVFNSYHKMKIEHMVDFDIWNKVTIFCLVCNINNILPWVIQLLESQFKIGNTYNTVLCISVGPRPHGLKNKYA